MVGTIGKSFAYSWNSGVFRLKQALKPESILRFLREEKWTILVTALGIIGLIVLEHTGWSHLSDKAWITIWAVYACMVLMVRGVTDPDICLFFATLILLIAEIITPRDAFAGFANDSIVTIAIMMAVAAGVEATGFLNFVGGLVLGNSPHMTWLGQLRLFSTVGFISAFTNNTPLVAVFIPIVEKWCRKVGASPSKYMIPLSYAAIVGGLCTIIGTSTNLIVAGLAQADFPNLKIGFFEVGIVGLPMAIAAMIYVVTCSPFLLPVRTPPMQVLKDNPRSYTVRVVVTKDFAFIGRTVEEAGLRSLRGLFVVDIERKTKEIGRNSSFIGSPSPATIVLEGDIITFAGEVEHVNSLLKINGLVTAGHLDFTDGSEFTSGDRVLAEVVVSTQNPLLGQTVRDCGFRKKYGAAIVAVHRMGHTLEGSIGDIVLHSGDTLLVETTEEFMTLYRYHRDFLLVSNIYSDDHNDRKNPFKMIWACAMFGGMVLINSLDVLPLSVTGLLVLYGMFFFRILTVNRFRDAIPGMIMLTVSGAFGIARAMTVTGVAKELANNMIAGFDWMGRVGPLFSVYLACVILTALLSNGASVTLMYPIAKAVAKQQKHDLKAYLYVIMLGATTDFSTPIGYQTNLMVAGPGGYEFLDFTRFGLPLQVICGVVTVGICYGVWLK